MGLLYAQSAVPDLPQRPGLGRQVWAELIQLVTGRAVSAQEVELPPGLDKLTHALLYLPLGWLLARATGRAPVALAVAALYGASDEIHQYFVPGRAASLGDLAADLLGSALGAWLGRR
ncbi:MAG: VanZ family protein [Deinococcus sp.]|nr:VanZ family protein [Deinococcus sp.]